MLLGLVGASPSAASGGDVLPARARPHGYSLADMTRELALFTTSGNDPAYYPDTPFQILYVEQFNPPQEDGDGLLFTGTGTFTARPGTMYFVPIWNADDSAPVLGVFPSTPAEGRRYFFEQSQLGGDEFQVIVDGSHTRVGRPYLAGPVFIREQLLDGVPPEQGGHNIMTLGVFLNPMRPGTHTVTIRGGLFGDLIADAYGYSFLREDFTYTIDVIRGPR
jgi:hypothetical protein